MRYRDVLVYVVFVLSVLLMITGVVVLIMYVQHRFPQKKQETQSPWGLITPWSSPLVSSTMDTTYTEYSRDVILEIPRFLTPMECVSLITLGEQKGFSRSLIQGYLYNRQIRDSSTCWLSPSDYPLVQNIFQRLYETFDRKFPLDSFEELQLVKYTTDGMYSEHYDQCDPDTESCRMELERFTMKPRVLTTILALNQYDVDYTGGGTFFKYFSKTFRPNQGDALVFRNMKRTLSPNDDCRIEPWSIHEGLPVLSGVRYIANVWVRGNCSDLLT